MEQNHIMNLLVMGADSTVPVTAASSYIQSTADLDDGAFSVCNDENLVLSAVTVLTDARVAATGVKLIGRYGTKLVQSDMIKNDDLLSYKGIAVVAAAEQVSHVGYTGSTGAIEVINDNTYKMKIEFEQLGRTGQMLKDVMSVFYPSDSSATATEIAFGLSDLLVKEIAKQAEKPLTFEVLNSAAVTAANSTKTAQEVTVVNGSKFITFETDMTYHAAGDATVQVGDLIRLGAPTAGTALTSPVYKVVKKLSATVAELDRPVTNASGTYDDASGTSDIEIIPAASIANYGFQITGLAQTYQAGKKPYKKIKFNVYLDGFGTTAVTDTTAMNMGRGIDKQIMDLEHFTHGQQGDTYRGDYMHNGYTTRVTSGNNFKQLALSWASNSRIEGIGGPGHNPKQLILAIDENFHNGDANDICIDVLDAYAGAVGFPACGLGV